MPDSQMQSRVIQTKVKTQLIQRFKTNVTFSWRQLNQLSVSIDFGRVSSSKQFVVLLMLLISYQKKLQISTVLLLVLLSSSMFKLKEKNKSVCIWNVIKMTKKEFFQENIFSVFF